jgi:hypothetical protein
MAVPLPPEREKNLTRRDGYTYQLCQIDYQRGCKFGLGIKHFQNKVLVSRIDEGMGFTLLHKLILQF